MRRISSNGRSSRRGLHPGTQHLPGILHGLGDIALAEADLERAAERYRESLIEARLIVRPTSFVCPVGGLAAVAAAFGEHERAAVLWGIVQGLEARYTPMLAYERAPYEQRLGTLDPDLVERGRALDEDAALDYALSVD